MVAVDQNTTMSSSETSKAPSSLLEDNKKGILLTNGESLKEESSEDEDKLVIHEERKEHNADANRSKSPLKRAVEESSEAEASSKKPRVESESMSSAQLESAIAFLKKDLEALEILMVQKEEEWNSLLRLTKHKEELYARLVRRQQTMEISNGCLEATKKSSSSKDAKKDNVVFLPEGSYAAIGESPFMLLKHFLGTPTPSPSVPMDPKVPTRGPNGPPPPYSTNNSNISVIDIHTPKSHSESPFRDVAAMKPILPKPPVGGGYPVLSSTGFGPQGPTVSIHQLIAAHRKDNPQVPPIRGAKRGAWRNKFDFEKRPSRDCDRLTGGVSSSIPSDAEAKALRNNNNNQPLPMSDPSVSYKDVLFQFAQLTQNEKKPGSPQISIIPVGDAHSSRRSEPIPDSTSVSRELSSQANNLESSSALAKLLLESGAGSQVANCKTPPIDLGAANTSSPQHLTLSALLSGGTTTTVKDKGPNQGSSQSEGGSKKNGDDGAPPSTNPKCQGCHKSTAKFVCAGCGNQWYCSRNCQVDAWEEHSEHCTM